MTSDLRNSRMAEHTGRSNFRNRRIPRMLAIACWTLILASAGNATAQTLNVGSSADFLNAIQTINSSPGTAYTLNFVSGFAMGQQTPDLSSTSTITLTGNSNTIDGGSQFQPLVIDSGTVLLQGLNTINPGQPVTINGGTLIDTTGSLQGTVVNNGAVQFYQTLIGEYSGNMSGTGSVEINSGPNGGGQVILSGTNSYTGGTIVDAGSTLTGTTSSLQGNINNSWLLQFNQATNGTYAGVISGNGGVEIAGGGTITFTGLNTYSGSTQIDSGSTLVGTTSTLQGDLIDNGAVQFNQAITGTYAGNLSGTGSVEINGGPVTFTGNNSYGGGTTIDNLSLLIGTTSNIQGSVTNNGFVQFNQAVAGTYGGNMSGAGGVEISGAGPITFHGTNSYTGKTFIDSGSTLIGTTSGVQGDIVNSGAVQFNQTSAGTYSGSMIGAGTVEISGSGPVTFTGLNSYTGGTTVDSGSTLIGTTNSLQGTILDNGALQFNQNSIGAFVDNISGTGSVEINGTGPVLFFGVNTYSGGTTVDSGSTLIGSTSNLQGNFVNNGAVQFNQGVSGTYAGNMSGTGSVEITGWPVTFSGTNTYAGGTTVDLNSMLIGSTTSLQGAITNNGVVQFSQNAAGTYSGNMTGSGGVEISGAGPITLSGLNSYSGGTLVDSGSTLIGTTNSLQGSIIDQGAVQFHQSLTGTYAGVLSGSGSVEIGGSGVVTFSGANTYTGGTTIDGGSTLIGTTTSLQGSIANNGAMHFNQGTSGTFASAISGIGSVEISGSGPVTFSGSNTYSGGTTVDTGSTLIGTTSSIQGQFINFGSLQFNQSTNGTYAGTIIGSGGVAIDGGGIVTLSGTNSYSGGTTIDSISGLIGTTSSLQGPIVVNGGMAFNQTSNGTFAGNISGVGLVEVAGGASITFSGSNSYTGGTILGPGTTLIGTTNSLTGPINNYGIVVFKQSTSGTYSDVISNAGSVEISGAGPITFTGANSYTGGTTIDSGSKLIGTTNSVQGAITNNGSVQFSQSIAGSYAGSMAGTGGVEISGGGPVTFSGTNSYTGGTIVDLNNTLIGTTSSLQGAITNNGSLQFNQGTSGVYGGNASGTGSVEISGGGEVFFTGTNTYTGGTMIDSGSGLIVAASNLRGAIGDNGTLQFRQNGSGNYAGNISGTGRVEISGPITLSGTNSYTGGTSVDSGAMLIGNTFGVQGNITNDGVVKFNPLADNGSISIGILGGSQPIPNIYSGNMTGTGSVEITSGLPIVFTGLNSYTGGTKVDSGAALWGMTDSIRGNITDNGSVVFSNSTNPQTSITYTTAFVVANNGSSWATPTTPQWLGIYSGNISGSGGVEIGGGGSVIFSGSNSYSGGTTVDAGSTLIGTSSSIQGAVLNQGFIQFDQVSAGTYSGNMSGAGGVEITGGPVTFSGTNSYTGGTTVDSGATLIGTTHSLQGLIQDSGLVKFNQTTSGTFAGSILGTGGVEIAGVGPITFSGINSYTGGTKIDNGSTLNVTGSIAGNVFVNSGGTLSGSGTFGNLTINAGGTIAPGTNSTLALNVAPGGTAGHATVSPPVTVTGNYLQSTGSTYTVGVNSTASDQIIATGTATIQNGTTLNIVADPGTLNVGTTYDILKATGGLTGTYSSVLTSGLTQNVVFTEQYGSNDLHLTVNSNLSPLAQSQNQSAVAAILDQSSGSATGGFATAITQLTTLSGAQLSSALNQISGDIYPSLSTVQRQVVTTQMQLLSNRLAGLSGPGMPGVAAVGRKSNIRLASSKSSDADTSDTTSAEPGIAENSWTTWAQGYGLGGNIGGDGNAGSTNYRLGGTLFGVENWLSESTMVGVLGGYAGTSIRDSQSGSSAQVNSYQVGLYELTRQESYYLSNIDAFTNNTYNVSRPISFGTIQETASGSSSGVQWSHYTELGSTITLDDIRLQPFTGLQYMYLDQRGYTESGAGSLDMTTGSQTVNSLRNSVGARLSTETVWRGILITPTLSARFQHEWGNGTQIVTSSFSGAPTASFAVSGNNTGRNFGMFTLGATAFLTENFSFYGSVDTQTAQNYTAVIGSGGFQYSW